MTSSPALSLAAALAWAGLAASGAAAQSADAVPSPIEAAALEAAAARVVAPDHFDPDSWRVETGTPVSADTTLEVLEISGPDPNGTIKVKFKTVPANAAAGEARVTLHGRVRGPALVARRALSGGAAIDPAALEIVETDLTRLSVPPLRDVRQVAGLIPLHAISAGRALTADLLAPPPVVRRGDALDLRFERGRLLVRTIGIARQDGAAGDLVIADNTATGASVVARVQPDGSLLVLRPNDSGRSRR